MERQTFERLQKKAATFAHTSLTYTAYENVAHYATLRDDEQALFLYGENREVGQNELHFAVGDPGDIIRQVQTLPGVTRVSFVPLEARRDFLRAGFTVYSDMRDFWISDLSGSSDAWDSGGLMRSDECAAVSDVSRSVRWQSRGFHGESPEWVASWAAGDNPEVEHAVDCAVLVCRDGAAPVGMVCVALYGHERPEGPVVWVRELVVRPERQGRGLGRRLLTQTLAYGRAHGARRSYLMADCQNANALRLYESVGFVAKADDGQLDMLYENKTAAEAVPDAE
ncbi:MAG: GNAT family N-acetyltransferase [Oscillospiraceae bacterium]|nr:GNAT family N-acetyltransferase [Oscillospiraceae bacterium]